MGKRGKRSETRYDEYESRPENEYGTHLSGRKGDGASGKGKKNRPLCILKSAIKHLAIVITVMIIGLGSLWLYTGSWPPVVVVKSGSMMHHETESEWGAIDTGDLILLKSVDEEDVRREITTWADKKEKHYGTWGDVIIFKSNGEDDTPLIHRAVVWLEVNLSCYNTITCYGATYDIPSLGYYGEEETIPIRDYPAFATNRSKTVDLVIDLGKILNASWHRNERPASGFITKGDNNPSVDQPILSMPVREKWVIGKAKGEVPWLGIISLIYQKNPDPIPSNSLMWFFFSIILIFGVSINLEFGIKTIRKHRKKKRERIEEFESENNARRFSMKPGGGKKKRKGKARGEWDWDWCTANGNGGPYDDDVESMDDEEWDERVRFRIDE